METPTKGWTRGAHPNQYGLLATIGAHLTIRARALTRAGKAINSHTSILIITIIRTEVVMVMLSLLFETLIGPSYEPPIQA